MLRRFVSGTFARICRAVRTPSVEPAGGEISPAWVVPLDQLDFLRPAPAFQLLLSRDRTPNVGRILVEHELRDVVPGREPVHALVPMFPGTPDQVVRHADVEAPRVAGKDVNGVEAPPHSARSAFVRPSATSI